MLLKLPVVSLLSQEELEASNVCKLEGGVIFLKSINEIPDEVSQYPTVVWEVPNRQYISKIGRLRKGCRDYVKVGDEVVILNRSRWVYA